MQSRRGGWGTLVRVITFPVEPMRAVLGKLPPDEGWAFEVKWDGYRTVAFVDDGHVRLQSASGRDVTTAYPEIARMDATINARQAVLDGELLVFDDDGRPSFELMQRHDRPATFHVFDVLSIDGIDAVTLPYVQRRALLGDLVESGSRWRVPSHRIGDGAALLEATAQQGLEGVMAKRLDSTYLPGKRSQNWRKVKNRQQVEVVIGGFTKGEGNRSGTFGALLVGRRVDGKLAFAGGVGTGFTQDRLQTLSRQLRDLAIDDCPFDPAPPTSYRRIATWIQPILTATVEITEFTNDGYVRQATFIGLATSSA